MTSQPVDLLSAETELFYRLLMSVVDDHGGFQGHPKILMARCHALQLDKVIEKHTNVYGRGSRFSSVLRLITGRCTQPTYFYLRPRFRFNAATRDCRPSYRRCRAKPSGTGRRVEHLHSIQNQPEATYRLLLHRKT